MRVWNNERGLTLTELMAAVVILGLVAVPLTSLGTTVLNWYQEDQQLNEAILLAESKMLLVKMKVEAGEWEPLEKQTEEGMEWTASVSEDDFQSTSGLKQITVTVRYPTFDSDQMNEHTLTAVARVQRP